MMDKKIYKFQNTKNISMLPGDPSGSPDEFFLENTLIFIDEGFVEKLSKYFGNGKYLKFDKISFSKKLCNKGKLNCLKIFYYTAPPFQSEKPTKEEELRKKGYEKFINKLRKQGVLVREGRCQRLKIDGNFIYKQKGVDTLLTIDLSHVKEDYPKIKKVIIVASDTDFVPVIEDAKKRGIEVILFCYYKRKRDTNFSRSNHLINSCSKYIKLTREDFNDEKA